MDSIVYIADYEAQISLNSSHTVTGHTYVLLLIKVHFLCVKLSVAYD